MNARFENFTFCIMKLNKLVNRIKISGIKKFGLKGIHVLCIYNLYVHGALTARELIKLTLEDKAAISRALKMLAEKEIVVYDSDGYNSPVELTELGVSVAITIEAEAEKAVNAAGGTLTDEQRNNFYRCLEIISTHLEEYYKTMSESGNE